MDLYSFVLISTITLIMEQEGCSSAPPCPVPPCFVELRTRVLHRIKRCSCDNLKDKECVYFCHIGIVWVNTPRQVIPYGVGSFHMRLRRDVDRCFCTNKSDMKCLEFCSRRYSHENASALRSSSRKRKERHKITVEPRQNV